MLVGASGVVVNLGVMAGLVAADLHYLAAGLVATEVSIAWNWLLYERFVFRDRRDASRWWHRAIKNLAYNNAEFAARVPFLVLAVSGLGVPETVAQLITLVLAFGLRFVFVSRVVYRPVDEALGGPPDTAVAEPPTDPATAVRCTPTSTAP